MKHLVAWIVAHHKQVKTDTVIVATALAAQPAFHAWVGGEHVAAAALVSAAVAAAGIAARSLFKP